MNGESESGGDNGEGFGEEAPTKVEEPDAVTVVAVIRELRRLGDKADRQALAIDRLAAAVRHLADKVGEKIVG